MIGEMIITQEDVEIMKDELAQAQNFVDTQKECIAPAEVYGAIDWAMDQLDIDCSNATTFVMGASTLLATSILI